MADIKQAAEWMKGGHVVSRKTWVRMNIAEDQLSGVIETRCYQKNVVAGLQPDDLLADDWLIDDPA